MNAPLTPPALIDDLKAPEFFASHIAGASFDGPNMHLTFASNRMAHAETPSASAVVNVRVVMSIPAAQQMCEFLMSFINTLESSDAQRPSSKTLN